jgi:hypothetical protein
MLILRQLVKLTTKGIMSGAFEASSRRSPGEHSRGTLS